ncbi:MAG: tetratricopeptide repeat protein [Vicinamibacterales bacterium]
MIALTFRRAAAGCLFAALTITAAAPRADSPQPTRSSSVAELLTSYAAWIDGGRTGVALVAVDLDAARANLSRFDPSSLPTAAAAGTPGAREEQRRLVTAFALELAAVGARRHAASAARLVEWACPYVRAHSPKNDFDRAWQLAALSVLEGGIDAAALRDHVDHVRALFPDEPRLLLARGIAEEQVSAPGEVLTRSVGGANLARAREAAARADGERYRASERAIDRFREAAKDASLRAEANLRLGHVKIEMGRYDEALEALTGVEGLTGDPAIAYLAHLFRGIALESRARTAEARASYRHALALSPGAHSATLRLAALEFRHGHGSEPESLIDGLLRDDDPRRDPWWSYYAGDWRLWYPRIERVRVLLKP